MRIMRTPAVGAHPINTTPRATGGHIRLRMRGASGPKDGEHFGHQDGVILISTLNAKVAECWNAVKSVTSSPGICVGSAFKVAQGAGSVDVRDSSLQRC